MLPPSRGVFKVQYSMTYFHTLRPLLQQLGSLSWLAVCIVVILCILYKDPLPKLNSQQAFVLSLRVILD